MAYGITVSKPGFDAKTAADFEKIFDSRWKCLKIEYQGSYTVTSSSSVQTIYTHGLGYAPFFWAFLKFGSTSTMAIADFFQSGFTENYSTYIRANSTSIVFDNTSGSYDGNEIYLYVFVDQINEAIAESKSVTTATTPASNNTYGFKISKPGFDVKTATGKDLIMSSEYTTLQINQVSVGSHNFDSSVLTISHGLGYVPQFYFYVRDIQGDGRWQMIGNRGIDHPNLTVQANTTSCSLDLIDGIFPIGTKDYSLIVFKDPIT